MNLSGIFNAFKLLKKPQLCLPHLTISTFDQLPIPLLSKKWPNIKAIVLDKDNCFAVNRGIYVYKPYKVGSSFFPHQRRNPSISERLANPLRLMDDQLIIYVGSF